MAAEGPRTAVVSVLPAVILPVSAGMRELHRESIVMNGVSASLRIFSCAGGEREYRSRLLARGWRRIGNRRAKLGTLLGDLEFTAWEKNDRSLLVGHPSADEDWVALALFAGKPAGPGLTGDAPGREPAGFPRPPSGTRIFHLAGGNWESAAYRSPLDPGTLLESAARKLAATGWKYQNAGADSLVATGPDGARAILLAMKGRSGCVFILMTGRLMGT
jgi:hypothetical protein